MTIIEHHSQQPRFLIVLKFDTQHLKRFVVVNNIAFLFARYEHLFQIKRLNFHNKTNIVFVKLTDFRHCSDLTKVELV